MNLNFDKIVDYKDKLESSMYYDEVISTKDFEKIISILGQIANAAEELELDEEIITDSKKKVESIVYDDEEYNDKDIQAICNIFEDVLELEE